MLKYDQTGEALQTTGTPDGCTEFGCSVLTPEQIYSQLSMVLHNSGGPAVGSVESGNTDSHGRKRERATAGTSGSSTLSETPVARKLTKTKTGMKRARERKARKGDQPKRAKEAEVARNLAEKRPPRHRLRQTRARKGTKPTLVENSIDPDTNTLCPSITLSSSATRPHHHVHVVEVSPETNSEDEGIAVSTDPNSVSDVTTIPSVSPLATTAADETHPPTHLAIDSDEVDASESSTKGLSTAISYKAGSAVSCELTASTKMVARLSSCHGSPCRPLNYELLGRLIGEPILTSFYHSFHSNRLSEHLRIEFLDPLSGEGSNLPHREAEILPRWLQITQKRMHIDPHLGPITLARILVSNVGIVKFQHLFPFTKTVFMQHVKSCDLETILSELSPRHVLCPGLPHYPKYHVALGYHPEGIRIRHIQTPDYQRYDHRKCPILHIPRKMTPQTDNKPAENMCSKCVQLHTSILKVICDKLSCTNPENWLPSSQGTVDPSHPTNSSTHQSTKRQTHNPATPNLAKNESTTTPLPVTTVTSDTPDLATYYRQLSGQHLISTLTTSPPSYTSKTKEF